MNFSVALNYRNSVYKLSGEALNRRLNWDSFEYQ